MLQKNTWTKNLLIYPLNEHKLRVSTFVPGYPARNSLTYLPKKAYEEKKKALVVAYEGRRAIQLPLTEGG